MGRGEKRREDGAQTLTLDSLLMWRVRVDGDGDGGGAGDRGHSMGTGGKQTRQTARRPHRQTHREEEPGKPVDSH